MPSIDEYMKQDNLDGTSKRRASKVSIELTPGSRDLLESLVDKADASSIHEVVKTALRLYDFVLSQPAGSQLFSKHQDIETKIVLV
jgi:hypothetical protein